MLFFEKMYVGKGINSIQQTRRKLEKGAKLKDIYVISLSNGEDQLECTHCSYFNQKMIRENVGMIVGIAKGYSEAQGLIIDMIEEALEVAGTANVKEYLLNHKQ